MSAAEPFRSGYVTICGYPNAGKSTLLNAFMEQRLAIVSPKPQTTRRRTLGIRTTDRCQMIFLDTPGILEPRYQLQAAMMRQVEHGLADADVVLYLVDLTHPRMAPVIAQVSRRKPVIVLLNKADLIARPEDTLPLIEELRVAGDLREFFAISALHARGVPDVLGRVEELLPEGPPFYPVDQITEHPERFFVGELVREVIFQQFRKEVPYGTEVEIADYKEKPEGKDFIDAIVYVESESQKGILIGKGGRAIKSLGQRARGAIEEFLGRPVYLSLQVKVLPNWRRDSRALRRFGYE
jgi:GTP-binding protein Era